MPSILEQAISWLDAIRQSHLSRAAVYRRGGESVAITATLGSTSYERADEAGAVVQAQATDFIVAASELVLGGVPVTPQVGDRIDLPAGDAVQVFEVLDLGGGAHYRPCDPGGRMLRIHTKRIGEETA